MKITLSPVPPKAERAMPQHLRASNRAVRKLESQYDDCTDTFFTAVHLAFQEAETKHGRQDTNPVNDNPVTAESETRENLLRVTRVDAYHWELVVFVRLK